MASSSTTRHGATANGRRSQTREARQASSARTSAQSNASTRPKTARPRSGPVRRRPVVRMSRGIIVAVIVAAMTLAIWGFYPVARVQYREEREKARLEAELKGLQERNTRLKKAVARLRTPEGVEDLARQNLGYVKKGEQAGVVLDSSADAMASSASVIPDVDTEEPAVAPRGPWTPVLDLVFGYRE